MPAKSFNDGSGPSFGKGLNHAWDDVLAGSNAALWRTEFAYPVTSERMLRAHSLVNLFDYVEIAAPTQPLTLPRKHTVHESRVAFVPRSTRGRLSASPRPAAFTCGGG